MKNIGRVTYVLFTVVACALFPSIAHAQLTTGSALRFNGNNSKVIVNNAPDLSNKSFTIEFWARRFSGNRSDYFVTQGTTLADNNYLHIGFRSENTFTFAFWNNDLNTGADMDQGWHHWACTFNSANRNRIIYRDGQIVGNDTATVNFQGTGTMALGGGAGPLDGAVAGMMDDVRVWNVVRTQSEIQTNMSIALTGSESGLLSYWKFDEGSGTTVNDSAGGDNTGTFLNSPTWGTTAMNYGIAFDGSNDYVSVANESSFDFTNACTIEAWIKVDAFTVDWQSIVTKGDTSWRLHRDAGNNGVAFGTTGLSNQDLSGTRNVNDGRWHHVAGVYDGSTKYLYVDGMLDVSLPATGTIANNNMLVNIGANSEVAGRNWNGAIDEVRVWNIARSASQISQNMYTFLAGTESGLIGYWRFSEGGGTIAFDSAVAGGNNDGTLMDGATEGNGPTWPFSSFVVKNYNDSGAGSLRQAILDINSAGSGIVDAQSLSGTINLSSSLPMITGSMTFLGSTNLTVSGNNLYRVFSVNSYPRSLLFSKLVIANGKAQGGSASLGGGGGGAGLGGGVFINSGNVVLSDVRFSGNSAIGGNGGSKGPTGSASSGGGGMGGNSATGDTINGGGGGGLTGAATVGAGGGPSGGAAGVSPTNNGGDGDASVGGGGGGGRSPSGNGGAGGLGGGGGGAGGDSGFSGSIGGRGGNGGFGGGGGGSGISDFTLQGRRGGNGGFGGGAGGNTGNLSETGALPGFGGGGSTTGPQANDRGAGGGGAGLGANIFVRSDNNASLTLIDCTIAAGSVAGGTGGTGASGGMGAGTSFFTINGNTDITVNSGRTETIAGTIAATNTTGLNKYGSGTLVLASTAVVPGTITVNAGTLQADGNITSNFVLNAGTTVSGSGTVATLNIGASTTVSPGNGIGTLNATNSTWSGAGNYNWQLYNASGTAGNGWDLLFVNGNLNLSSASAFKINLWTLAAPGINGVSPLFDANSDYSWPIARVTGSIVGFNAANFTIVTNVSNGTSGFANATFGGKFSLQVVGKELLLVYVAPPSITTLAATNVTDVSGWFNGTVNPKTLSTTVYFEFGTTTNYGSQTAPLSAGNGSSPVGFTQSVSNLFSGIVYHYRAVATFSSGTNFGADRTLTTLQTAVTLPATSVTTTSAVLNAKINLAVRNAYFQYWPTAGGATNTTAVGSTDSPSGLVFTAPSNQHIYVTNPVAPVGNSSYTIEAWVRPSIMGTYGIIGWGNYGGSNQANALRLSANGIVNYWGTGSQISAVTGDITAKWHHIAASYDGANRFLYLDGALVASNSASGLSVSTASNLTLAKTGFNEYFWGSMDDVRVWSVCRSQADITNHMYLVLNGSESGLISYWKFDEGSGGAITDSSGHSGTGYLQNFPIWQGGAPTSVGANLFANANGLSPGVNYSFRIVAVYDTGTLTGSNLTFHTIGANANLSAIVPSLGTLTPSFSSNITSYAVTVANTNANISIAATNADAFASVQVGVGNPYIPSADSRSFSLSFGSNPITITGKAENGVTTKGYNVTVTRPFGTNVNLSNLTLSAGTLTPTFNSSTYVYSASVGGLSSNVLITATAVDPYASIRINSGSTTTGTNAANVAVALGTNTIPVVVQSQDAVSTKTNLITIIRADAPLVVTLAASNVVSDSALLNGTVNPQGAATLAIFKWGTTTNMNQTTTSQNIPAGTNTVAITQSLTSLIPNTTNYFQLIASNSQGIVTGNMLSFVTPGPLAITSITRQGNGTVLLEFNATTAGLSYTLQGSTNLADWPSITNWPTVVSNQFNFMDMDATNYPLRYYRLKNP